MVEKWFSDLLWSMSFGISGALAKSIAATGNEGIDVSIFLRDISITGVSGVFIGGAAGPSTPGWLVGLTALEIKAIIDSIFKSIDQIETLAQNPEHRVKLYP